MCGVGASDSGSSEDGGGDGVNDGGGHTVVHTVPNDSTGDSNSVITRNVAANFSSGGNGNVCLN